MLKIYHQLLPIFTKKSKTTLCIIYISNHFSIRTLNIVLFSHFRMIFRDLKPENVGFTHENEIKLFDFGLARELKEERKVGRDKYLLSLAGTRRYMAPEVIKGSPYGLPADVFSFSLLLWEMVHIEKPYRNLDAKQHERALVLWRSRPKVSSEVPRAVKSIILKAWNNDAKCRPKMDRVLEKLQLHLESVS